MKTATQNLENDHDYILRLTDVMLAMVKCQSVKIEHFEMVISLIKNFADGSHHAKEENYLFPLMGAKGYSPEHGPVAVMLHEHEQGRNFVKGAVDAILELKKGNSYALQTIYDNMKGYAHLLKSHIDKENNILFRMADQAFSTEEQQNLLIQFAAVEENTKEEFNLNNSIQKIADLAAIYLK
jgi:hemerythrin-like domain-containing protein